MVLTSSQEQRLSRLEEMCAERSKMMKQLADMVEAFSRSIAVEHRMVNLVPEAQQEKPKTENHEGWEQVAVLEVEGNVERGQEVQSMEKICSAHQVFDKMSQHQERLGIRKKKKGFKSWMFKYKKGNKKQDLLLLNGKDSLALRAIGSKLETGEIVYQIKRETSYVKGWLERLQASVLMEEEPDSMRVNQVKLENNKTGTKLKVKKHDNLSWKEDESRSICCILKLGGVAITCKNVLEKIYDENLEIVACRLRPAMMESSVPSKVIGRDGSKRHGRSEVSCDVDYLGDHESSSFRESVVASTDLSMVTKIIDSGIGPLHHRDAVLDNILGCTILSGDVIICHFVDHLKPECVVCFAKEASGKLEQFSGLCKELMDIDVSLVAAANWSSQMHVWSTSYHVWHRWKAQYSQNFDNRVWDPGG